MYNARVMSSKGSSVKSDELTPNLAAVFRRSAMVSWQEKAGFVTDERTECASSTQSDCTESCRGEGYPRRQNGKGRRREEE